MTVIFSWTDDDYSNNLEGWKCSGCDETHYLLLNVSYSRPKACPYCGMPGSGT